MSMVLHKGAVFVPRAQLANAVPPPAVGRFQPVAHSMLADAVEFQLQTAGYEITKERHGLTRGGQKYFGLFELQDMGGYAAALGVRSSYDKSTAIRLACGSTVFVCDNMALSGDIQVFRKHTTEVLVELGGLLEMGISKLAGAITKQNASFSRWKESPINAWHRDNLIAETYRQGIVPSSQLGQLFDEFKVQTVDHGPPTLWRMFNAGTHVLKDTPGLLPERTQRLHKLVDNYQLLQAQAA